MTIPSYLVLKEEENSLQFSSYSPFADGEHPERVKKEEKKVPQAKENEKVTV